MKTGDKVVMNDNYYVSETNRGRVWTVTSEPWNLCGTIVVALDGKSGGYAVDGLDLVEEASTIDTVVHGRNVSERNTVDEFECSECGVILEGYSQAIIDEHDNDRSNREYEHRFCPECGAKIDLEVT